LRSVCAITFDLDDTLWAIGPVIRRAEAELWSWLSENHPVIVQNYTAAGMLELRQQLSDEYPERSHDFRYLRKQVLVRVALDCGYGAEMVDPAFDVFDAARNSVDFYPDVFPALQQLSEDFTLVAVTNGNANLETIGIDHLFSDVVTAVGAGAAKPHRAIFDEAIKRTGAAAEEILHVGDHPELDVDGARNAGMRTAWINRCGEQWPQHLPPPDAEISAINELQRLLRPQSLEG
jgi:2-haloalkanoic acid dehalogenase type II